jgi:hypothetical protein
MAERAKLVELPDTGFYTLPIARDLIGILPPLGEEAARIRLRVVAATTLDLPLSQKTLVALVH